LAELHFLQRFALRCIALLQSNGSLDTSFNPDWIQRDGQYVGVATNGQILVGATLLPTTARREITSPGLIRRLIGHDVQPGTALNARFSPSPCKPAGRWWWAATLLRLAEWPDKITGAAQCDGSFDPGFDPGSGANALSCTGTSGRNILVAANFQS